MFQVNIAAIILNVLYTLLYAYYSTSKWEEVYKSVGLGMALVFGIFSYVAMETPENLEFRYGFLITILSLLLLASPLTEIVSVFR